jgi:hypothetical protein
MNEDLDYFRATENSNPLQAKRRVASDNCTAPMELLPVIETAVFFLEEYFYGFVEFVLTHILKFSLRK